MGLFSWLFGKREPEKPTLVCMRQEQTWRWPSYLGERTAGTCEECEGAIFYEKQNEGYRKICNVCAGMT